MAFLPVLLLAENAPPAVNPSPESGPVARAPRSTFYAKPGPWGQLRCAEIFIEPPDSLINRIVLPTDVTEWFFPVSEAEHLPELFDKAGLPAGLRAALLDPANTRREEGMVILRPPLLDLMDMTPAMRTAIYRELSRYPENGWHNDPKLITTPTVDEWYRGSRLNEKLLSLIRQTAYPIGSSLALSDMPALINYAESDAEARALLKAHGRAMSLLVRLELDADTDLETIIDYWTAGVGSKRKDIEPLLRSVRELPAGRRNLDIIHLLPPLPRMILYTYPGYEFHLDGGILPDCHWTSLNFFSFASQPHLANDRLAASCFRDQYEYVDPPYKFGDIIGFMDVPRKVIFHSCVYLADDLVLTKNGRHILRPWVIEKLDHVKSSYFLYDAPRIQGLRDKRLNR